MEKSKIAISTFTIVCIISTIIGYCLLKQNENNKYNQLAVMLKQNDGTYIRSNMSVFGNDDYEFDHAVCNNGSTITANLNKGVNLKLLGADKCTVYLKLTVIGKIKSSAKEGTSSMYSAVEPSNEIKSVTDNKFSKEKQIYTVDTTHQSYYMTYANSYIFNTPDTTSSGTDYPTYTLTSAATGKYSEIYNELAGKYIVNYEGHTESTATKSANIDRIYKVVSATANSITYIPSSYTIEFTNSTTGMYTIEDDYGTSYYYRGNATDNYIKFGKWTENIYRGYNVDQSSYKEYFTQAECQADGTYKYGCNKSPVAGKDMYWRIVRINGDRSLRLMYDGTEAYANGTKNLDRIALQYQKFNNAINNNAHIGYMYGDINGTTYDKVHANTNPSAIKTTLETWYEKNFVGKEYENKIGDMSFCNDRSIVTAYGITGTGIGSAETYYGAVGRLVSRKSPSLICSKKENDLFTSNASTQGGNGKLNKPVGLLTADEVALAGNVYSSKNRGSYINKGDYYWLGSPFSYYIGAAYNYNMTQDAYLHRNKTNYTYAVVPIINLSSDYANKLKGSGTMEDPYTA